MRRTLVPVHLVALVAVTLFARTSLAQRSPAANADAAPHRGDIHGRVLSAPAGAPVAGATVEVTSTSDTTPLARVATGVDGTFRVERLAPGRYRARVRRLGFTPKVIPSVVVTAASP